ncbi:hypothetical protein EET67_04090 [Pseudaminobacter arsenicus]|uniref:Uncharacterized protein n=1 Tax=Borborobacter arsenicus TaxID=1851146 RepID=A0A432V9Q6_9HYPH|nr:hypothetical protein [Pseudaminobacter arsenicus]RUM98833.1 hypothetical protein EET67_04090 [Pseudaminobacter arsenicus]
MSSPAFYHPVKAIRISETRQSAAGPIHHWLRQASASLWPFAAQGLYQEFAQQERKDQQPMAKKPNYNHERRERDRIKAAKKAAKANAKASKTERRIDSVESSDAT